MTAGSIRSVCRSRSPRRTVRCASIIWPLSEYLRRVAGEVPAAAAAVVGRLAGTANPIVQRDLVAALLRLPAASAAGFTDDVITWIRGPYARWLDEKDLSELAARLLDEGQQEAGRRLASVILAWLEGSYWLREAVALLADPLQRSGVDGVLVLADALDHVIGDESSAEMASFSRASIADHEQDQHIDAADHLIDGLRDGALAYLRRTGDLAVLIALLRRRAALYARIVYYMTAAALSETDASGADPAAAFRSAALRSYARTLVMDKAAFADSRTRLEYGALARAMLAHLTPGDVAQFADWLRQGPQMSDTEISQMLGSAGRASGGGTCREIQRPLARRPYRGTRTGPAGATARHRHRSCGARCQSARASWL